MVGEEKFRGVMGHFATGVTVLASRGRNGEPVGLTVNAFTSVSLDPPLVLVCIHMAADAHDPLIQAGHFGVSVLAETQGYLAMRFSADDPETRFRELEWETGPLGSPLIPGALAWIECRIRDVYPGGDHSIVVGEVVECDSASGNPLLFFQGSLMDSRP